jgi:ADP-ribose pyrophosphatase YjhB (NUDIX family)
MLVDERGRQFRIGVYGLAVTDGAVLLARLGPVEAEVGAWTLPGGGLDWGEHPVEGLEREFVEETGLHPIVLQPLGIHSFVVSSARRKLAGPDIHVAQAVYLVSARGNPANEIDGSTDEAEWWPLDRLREVRLVELVEVALGWFSSLPTPRPLTG